MNFKKFILLLFVLNFCLSAAIAVPKYLNDEKSNEPLYSGYKKVVNIPQNYKLSVDLKKLININSVSVPDKVEADLKNDFLYKGQLIAPEGSIVKGNVTNVQKADKKTKAFIKVKFTAIITPDNQIIPISAVFVSNNNDGILYADENGDFLPDNQAQIVIMQPVTYVPKK